MNRPTPTGNVVLFSLFIDISRVDTLYTGETDEMSVQQTIGTRRLLYKTIIVAYTEICIISLTRHNVASPITETTNKFTQRLWKLYTVTRNPGVLEI